MASSPSQVIPPFSAPGLILRLLFLSPVVLGNCSGDGQQLLGQLQNQANFMQDTSVLLDPYVSTGPRGHLSLSTLGLGQERAPEKIRPSSRSLNPHTIWGWEWGNRVPVLFPNHVKHPSKA